MTASFIPFFIISFLVIIHELGHFIIAKILKIEVIKIYLYPLGGITKLNMDLNISILKEIIVLIAGPIFQIFAYIFLKNIFNNYSNMIIIYHYGILIFNLLPIYPLDGGKLLNILISLKIPYKKTYKITILISYIIIFLILIINRYNIKLNIIIVIIFLMYKVTKEYNNIEYIYQKFLLERYINKYKFKNTKIINSINNFYRNNNHILKIDNKYYKEREILAKKYKKL